MLFSQSVSSASMRRFWGQRLLALGSWLLALGSWLLALGSWLLALGSWLLALGSWLLALGSWLLALGSLYLQTGIVAMYFHENPRETKFLDHGVRADRTSISY